MTDLQIYNAETDKLTLALESSFEDCEFRNYDWSSASLKAVSFLNCKFVNCNMANVSFLNASVRECRFESCNLLGVNWCNLKRLESLQFSESKLNFSSFQGVKLKKLVLTNCLAHDVDFSGADLSLADFSGTELRGTNFDRANLTDVDFRTSREYLFDLRTAKIKGVRVALPECLALLTVLGAKVEE